MIDRYSEYEQNRWIDNACEMFLKGLFRLSELETDKPRARKYLQEQVDGVEEKYRSWVEEVIQLVHDKL